MSIPKRASTGHWPKYFPVLGVSLSNFQLKFTLVSRDLSLANGNSILPLLLRFYIGTTMS